MTPPDAAPVAPAPPPGPPHGPAPSGRPPEARPAHPHVVGEEAAPAAPGGSARPTLRTGLLILVALILAGWALRATAVVMVPLVTAILTALAVMPVRDWVRDRMPRRLRWLGVAAAMGMVVLVLSVFFGGLYVAGRQLAGQVPEAAEQITGMLGAEEGATEGAEGSIAEGARAGADQAAEDGSGSEAASGAASGAGPGADQGTGEGTGERTGEATGGEEGPGGLLGALSDPREALRQASDQLLGAAGGAAGAVMNAGLSILGGLVLVFFMTFLILIESGDWARKTERLAGARAEWRLLESTEVVAAKFRSYVLLQASFGLVTAALYAGWLTLWQLDLILVWALLTFLMNFIPNLGSIVAGGTTTAYAFATKDLGTALAVGAGILTIEQVMGNVVAPQLQGRNIALSPLVVLVSLVFWGWTWGIAGALLAVPVTFAIVVLMAHAPALRPWALLLTDQTDLEGLDEATRR